MFLAVGSAQAADAVTFVRMIRDHGVAAEANPLVARIASFGDLAPLIVAKAALVLLVVGVFVLLVRRNAVAGSLIATFAVVAGLIGAYSNVAVIVAPAGRLLPL